VLEQDWAALVRAIAAGDQLALHALYERAHRIVFTLVMRLTANRETAEELTIDVFHDIWRRASDYDAASGTVLGWIMNQARSRAIDRLRFESRKNHARRAPGDRDDVLRRAHPRGSRGAARSTGRYREDAHPVRAAEAATHAGRGMERS
jgi:DNA-directed RNA polymerase specialized sigma24 family protein